MKPDPRLALPFLNIESIASLSSLTGPFSRGWRFLLSLSLTHSLDIVFGDCPNIPNLPVTFEGLSSWPFWVSFPSLLWDCSHHRQDPDFSRLFEWLLNSCTCLWRVLLLPFYLWTVWSKWVFVWILLSL